MKFWFNEHSKIAENDFLICPENGERSFIADCDDYDLW